MLKLVKKYKIEIYLLIIIVISILGLVNIKLHSKTKENYQKLEHKFDELTVEKHNLLEQNENLSEEVGNLNVKLEGVKEQRDNLEEKVEEQRIKLNSNRGTSSSRGRLLGTFEATAYTDNVQSQGKWVGQTATGVKPQVGVIAVDPKVIPLGSKVIVEGYNNNKPVLCGDVGGAIKGNRIDVFLSNQKEVVKYGRKKVKVWKAD